MNQKHPAFQEAQGVALAAAAAQALAAEKLQARNARVDPAPPPMAVPSADMSVRVRRADGERWGLRLCGGTEAPPVVVSVAEDGLAHGRLQVGDLIMSVDGVPYLGHEAATAALKAAAGDVVIVLRRPPPAPPAAASLSILAGLTPTDEAALTAWLLQVVAAMRRRGGTCDLGYLGTTCPLPEGACSIPTGTPGRQRLVLEAFPNVLRVERQPGGHSIVSLQPYGGSAPRPASPPTPTTIAGIAAATQATALEAWLARAVDLVRRHGGACNLGLIGLSCPLPPGPTEGLSTVLQRFPRSLTVVRQPGGHWNVYLADAPTSPANKGTVRTDAPASPATKGTALTDPQQAAFYVAQGVSPKEAQTMADAKKLDNIANAQLQLCRNGPACRIKQCRFRHDAPSAATMEEAPAVPRDTGNDPQLPAFDEAPAVAIVDPNIMAAARMLQADMDRAENTRSRGSNAPDSPTNAAAPPPKTVPGTPFEAANTASNITDTAGSNAPYSPTNAAVSSQAAVSAVTEAPGAPFEAADTTPGTDTADSSNAPDSTTNASTSSTAAVSAVSEALDTPFEDAVSTAPDAPFEASHTAPSTDTAGGSAADASADAPGGQWWVDQAVLPKTDEPAVVVASALAGSPAATVGDASCDKPAVVVSSDLADSPAVVVEAASCDLPVDAVAASTEHTRPAAVAGAASCDFPAELVAASTKHTKPAAVADSASCDLPAVAVAVSTEHTRPDASVAAASCDLPSAAVAASTEHTKPAAAVVAASCDLPAAAVAVSTELARPSAAVGAAPCDLPADAVADSTEHTRPAVAVGAAETAAVSTEHTRPAAAVGAVEAVAGSTKHTVVVDGLPRVPCERREQLLNEVLMLFLQVRSEGL